ncbi:hypothetical protein HDU93_007179 [Gonapodya sp. JEL0774]|nr:hypothetical protein HDU93_007179 [Gonapodya sp. JEL0774]
MSDLPFDILVPILLLLPPREVVSTIPLVNRKWRQAADVLLDSENRVPLELDLVRPDRNQLTEESCVTLNNPRRPIGWFQRGRREMKVSDSVAGASRDGFAAGRVVVSASATFFVERSSENAERTLLEVVANAIGKGLTPRRIRLHLRGFMIPFSSVKVEGGESGDIEARRKLECERMLDFARRAQPSIMLMDWDLVLIRREHEDWVRTLPSVTQVCLSDMRKLEREEEMFYGNKEILESVLDTFPNVEKVVVTSAQRSLVPWAGTRTIRTIHPITQLKSILFFEYSRDPRYLDDETRQLKVASLLELPMHFPELVEIGELDLYPYMWGPRANMPDDQRGKLAGLLRVRTLHCSLGWEDFDKSTRELTVPLWDDSSFADMVRGLVAQFPNIENLYIQLLDFQLVHQADNFDNFVAMMKYLVGSVAFSSLHLRPPHGAYGKEFERAYRVFTDEIRRSCFDHSKRLASSTSHDVVLEDEVLYPVAMRQNITSLRWVIQDV